MSPYQNSNVEDQFSTNFDLGFSGINNLHQFVQLVLKILMGKIQNCVLVKKIIQQVLN